MTRSALALSLLAPLLGGCGLLGGGPPAAPGAPAPAPVVRSTKDEVQERRDEIKALADEPDDASSDVLKLLKAMDDPDAEVRWRAEFALGRINAKGIRVLGETLIEETGKVRQNAAFVLGPFGKRAKPAIPALLRTVEDKDKNVRIWTVKALGDIDAGNADVTAAVIRALRDPEPDVRRVALAIVIRQGPAASGAATVLADVLQDADAGIRARACQAFQQLSSDGKSGIPALITRLSDYDAEVRARAADALCSIGPSGLDPLVRALKERDPKTRRAAAEILGSFGNEARSAVTDLTETSKDDDASIAEAATLAIKRIQEGGDPGAKGTTFIDAPGTVQRRNENFKWAKFGLMVHAGLPSVPARAKPGQVSELVQLNDRLPIVEYETFALKFGADKLKAAEWAKLANETGARYLVMTAKHHDGFCLWNTKLINYSAAKLGPKRDLLGEVAAACEKENVKFGAYYSMLDWHHPTYEKPGPRYVDFMHGQIRELLAGYPLWGLWFDGEGGRTKEEWRSDEIITMIRQAKPLAFINDRLGRDTRAKITGVDFYSQQADATVAALKLQGRPLAWEQSMAFGESWAYTESPDPLKSGERIIVEMVDAASKGGNFVLKIGARPDGSIPEPLQARMKVIGDWLRKNGDAVFDTERSPFGGNIPAGRVTVKGNRLYVFLEEYPKDGVIALPGLKTPVHDAWVLDGKRELKVKDTGVKAPDLIENSPLTVVAIDLEGAPEIQR